jgi:hypothetical protein
MGLIDDKRNPMIGTIERHRIKFPQQLSMRCKGPAKHRPWLQPGTIELLDRGLCVELREICALSITPYQATCQKLALFADPGKCGMLVGRGALDIPARES